MALAFQNQQGLISKLDSKVALLLGASRMPRSFTAGMNGRNLS